MNVLEIKAALQGSAMPVPETGATQAAPIGGFGSPPPTQSPSASGEKIPLPNGGRYAKYAGKLGCALTVGLSAAIIRRGGHEPNEPDDSDTRMLEEALEEGVRLHYGDRAIPWWLGSALAAGGVYAGMRVGAPKVVREADLVSETLPPSDASPVESALEEVPVTSGIVPPPMKVRT